MSDENKKYVPELVFLVCDKGTVPTQLICDPQEINIYGVRFADENDNKPLVNITSFGACKTLGTCVPPAGLNWTKLKEDVTLHGFHPLLEDSECLCAVGAGIIKIYFDKYAAELAAEDNSESDFVTEPISNKVLGLLGSGLLGMIFPNYGDGVGRGLKKGAEGTWNLLKDIWNKPGETLGGMARGLGSMAVLAAVYGSNASKPGGTIQSEMMLRTLDARFGTDFVGTRDALATGVGGAVENAVENVQRGNWGEVGEDVGQIQYAVVEAIVGTKGAGLAFRGVRTGAQVGLNATRGLIGAQRLAQIGAKSAQVLNRIKFAASGIVKTGRRLAPRVASLDDFTKSVKGLSEGQNPALARQAHELYTQQRWGELEDLFNKHGLNGGYPPNGGAIATRNTTLQPGTRIDRYGGYLDNESGNFIDKGQFLSPEGIPFDSRALPEGSLTKPYTSYEVLKPIPNVQEGQVTPWFGREGMGTQYQLPGKTTIQDLIDNGYIRKVPK